MRRHIQIVSILTLLASTALLYDVAQRINTKSLPSKLISSAFDYYRPSWRSFDYNR